MATNEPQNLAGKVILVTGGASGMGAAACTLMAKRGGTVIVSDVNDADGKALAAAISAHYVHLDIADEASWKAAMDHILAKHERLDVLVNNAAVVSSMPLADISLEEFRRLHKVNFHGTFLGMKYATEAMRKGGKGGSIINQSSILGLRGMASMVHYSSSKGGVKLMTKALALELGAEGIRVNSIHPGYIWTPFMESVTGPEAKDDPAYQALHPIGRLGKPEDVAEGIAFLASDDSKFMTGAELPIDGGLQAR